MRWLAPAVCMPSHSPAPSATASGCCTAAPPNHSPSPAQILAETLNFAWFAGSTAVLLTLPILVELNREHTVRMAQEQREAVLNQVREQAKQQTTLGQIGSVIGNLGLGGLGGGGGGGATGGGGAASAGEAGDRR